jgi:hypothetical protein
MAHYQNLRIFSPLNEHETALILDRGEKLIFVIRELEQQGISKQGSGFKVKSSSRENKGLKRTK